MASRIISSAVRRALPACNGLPRQTLATTHGHVLRNPISRNVAGRQVVVNLNQARWHSAPASKSQAYEFDQIKSLSETPSKDRVLIDVREPSEYAEGYIPGAINLPIKTAPEALLLPADEFEDRFDMPKPTVDQEVVFYCKAGVRSSAAAKLAEQAGYQKIGEYRGSWMDWAAKGGKVQH